MEGKTKLLKSFKPMNHFVTIFRPRDNISQGTRLIEAYQGMKRRLPVVSFVEAGKQTRDRGDIGRTGTHLHGLTLS